MCLQRSIPGASNPVGCEKCNPVWGRPVDGADADVEHGQDRLAGSLLVTVQRKWFVRPLPRKRSCRVEGERGVAAWAARKPPGEGGATRRRRDAVLTQDPANCAGRDLEAELAELGMISGAVAKRCEGEVDEESDAGVKDEEEHERRLIVAGLRGSPQSSDGLSAPYTHFVLQERVRGDGPCRLVPCDLGTQCTRCAHTQTRSGTV